MFREFVPPSPMVQTINFAETVRVADRTTLKLFNYSARVVAPKNIGIGQTEGAEQPKQFWG